MARVAVITGQSRGLGAVLASRFRDDGYAVPSCRRSDLEIRDPESIIAYVSRVLCEYGRIDILINNAAILGPVGPLETGPDWTETLQVNLIGPVALMAAVIPIMKDQHYGRIINIAGGGATGPLPRRAAYAASKTALIRATESVAEELSGTGVEANAVLPGPMPTDMMRDILSAGPAMLGEREYREHLKVSDDHALQRAASLCLHLAGTSGLTGRTISARHDPWPFDQAAISSIMISNRYTLRRIDNGN